MSSLAVLAGCHIDTYPDAWPSQPYIAGELPAAAEVRVVENYIEYHTEAEVLWTTRSGKRYSSKAMIGDASKLLEDAGISNARVNRELLRAHRREIERRRPGSPFLVAIRGNPLSLEDDRGTGWPSVDSPPYVRTIAVVAIDPMVLVVTDVPIVTARDDVGTYHVAYVSPEEEGGISDWERDQHAQSPINQAFTEIRSGAIAGLEHGIVYGTVFPVAESGVTILSETNGRITWDAYEEPRLVIEQPWGALVFTREGRVARVAAEVAATVP